MLFHQADAHRASQLAGFLTGAGVAVVPPPETAAADAVVVFLSAAGLQQPEWVAWAAAATAECARLLPVRVGRIDEALVPARLSELNWIDWLPGNVRATFGYVLAGLLSDPGRRDLARQLSHEAEAWLRSGRSDALLITDYRRARRMAGMLHDLEADRLAAPTPAMRQFVLRSVRVSRPRHRRRRTRLILSMVGVFVALGTVAVALPAIKLGSYNNKESVVTTGDQEILRDLPEWSAANAAALLADGTPAEQALARVTLLRALSTPWELDALQWRVSPNSSVPFQHGQLAIVSFGTGLAVINVGTQQVVWAGTEPGGPYDLSVDPAGRTALGLSMSGTGAIVINLATRTVRHIASGTRFVDPALDSSSYGLLGSDGTAIVRLPGQHLGEVNAATGTVTDLGAYSSVLNLAAKTPQTAAAALVKDRAGRVDLISVPSRSVIASLQATAATLTGAIAPDGRHAVVTGGDGQLWEIGAGQPAMPTGIPVPRILSGVTWSAGDRVTVESQDQRGLVYYLPGAELLGTVCWQNPRLDVLVTDYSSDVVACEAPGGTTFWELPPGPLARPVPGEAASPSWHSGPVTVTSSGPQIRIRGPHVDSGQFQPLADAVTAVDVADNGTRVVVGDTVGEVAVIDVEKGYTETVATWAAPDASPVKAVGWSGGPVATTASGQTWRTSDCADCGTDAGLLRTYRARITGCFTARQLSYMAASTWHALGLRECTAQPAVPSASEGH